MGNRTLGQLLWVSRDIKYIENGRQKEDNLTGIVRKPFGYHLTSRLTAKSDAEEVSSVLGMVQLQRHREIPLHSNTHGDMKKGILIFKGFRIFRYFFSVWWLHGLRQLINITPLFIIRNLSNTGPVLGSTVPVLFTQAKRQTWLEK